MFVFDFVALVEKKIASLKEVEDAIKESKGLIDQYSLPKDVDNKNGSMNLNIIYEFIASLLLGAGIGYGLDYWFSTKPFMFLTFLLLGLCTFIFNLYRNLGR